jgi:hypothetical protein
VRAARAPYSPALFLAAGSELNSRSDVVAVLDVICFLDFLIDRFPAGPAHHSRVNGASLGARGPRWVVKLFHGVDEFRSQRVPGKVAQRP